MDATALRRMVVEQMDRLHSGRGDPKVANAIANQGRVFIGIVRIELEYCKMTGTKPAIGVIKTNGLLAAPKPKHKKKTKLKAVA